MYQAPTGLVQQRIQETDAATTDELVAACSSVRLLITASSGGAVEAIARRVHAASFRAGSPFIQEWAGALPIDPRMLSETCANLIHAANGGSLLLTDVEDMPATVQDRLLEVLADLQGARDPSATVRLIAGTTVSLCERIADGTFSAWLFYRLNVIDLVPKNATAEEIGVRAGRSTCVDSTRSESACEQGSCTDQDSA